MDTLIQIQNASKSYGVRSLFSNISFAVNSGEHLGVIGPNGAGKSTLIKILTQHEELDDGKITSSKKLRMAYLPQHDDWEASDTIETYVLKDAILDPWVIKSKAKDLGLMDEHFTQAMNSFSGGYKMRAKILKLVGQSPNLMMLDEPTNYLDLETLLLLEKFLLNFDGAFLLISHDREFLRRTTDHILEVEAGEVTKFNGNIDDYFEQKEMLRQQLLSRATSVQNKRKEILDFVARFGASASKAKQAQSRLKSLNRLEKIEIKPLPVSAKIKIPDPARSPRVTLNLQNSRLGYPEKTILNDASLEILRGEHLAVVGLNGAGKSTLLKSLAGELPLKDGSLHFGNDVSIGYFAQHVSESLDPKATVYSELAGAAHPDIGPQDVLDLAASLLFSGDNVKKSIAVLSGGEKSRVALGKILLSKASCLILDEPTNHLDFDTVEALTQALAEFKGSLVVVSHDRGFIKRVGNKILEVSTGRLAVYPGTYEEYVWSLEQGSFFSLQNNPAKQQIKQEPTPIKNTEPTNFAQPKQSISRENAKEMKKQERRLMGLDAKIKELQEALAQQTKLIAQSSENATPSAYQILAELQKTLDLNESEWMECAELIENLKTNST